MHWARDCPYNEGDTTEEVEITMVTYNVDEHTSNFVRETFNSAILEWMHLNYMWRNLVRLL